MIVVADSAPLHYLILIEQTELLSRLYGSVTIPQAVLDELRVPQAPAAVREMVDVVPTTGSL